MRFPSGFPEAIGRRSFAGIAVAMALLFSVHAPGICGIIAAPSLCDDSAPAGEDGEMRDAQPRSAQPGARIGELRVRSRPIEARGLGSVRAFGAVRPAAFGPCDQCSSPRLRC